MSPDAKRSFEAEWPILARRLRLLLVRKNVHPSLHDDLVQETALRLVSMWETVDPRRPLWPLTVTITLNLLRDRARTVQRDDLVAEVPDRGALYDVEAAGLARIELERVGRAMAELSRLQRSALLRELGGDASSAAPDGAADKMLRMRARRKLKLAMENVSGVVALRLRRLMELVEGAIGIREGAVSAASCGFCLVLGVGAALAPPASMTESASAHPVARDSAGSMAHDSAALLRERSTFQLSSEPRGGTSEARAEAVDDAAGSEARAGSSRTKKQRRGDQGGAAGSEGGPLLGVLPQDGDQVIPPPNQITVAVETDDPPPLPGGGSDGDGGVPPPPSPPPPPPPPGPPVNAGTPVPAVVEGAQDLL